MVRGMLVQDICFRPRRLGARGQHVGTTSGSVRGGSNHHNPSARLIWSPGRSRRAAARTRAGGRALCPPPLEKRAGRFSAEN
eukprot:COSAG01_NODE_45619_length_407_cov_12.555195_1_plen_81_part_10